MESSGFREILKKLKPDCLEDVVAAVALYRPGPLDGGMVDDFIDRKHKRKAVEYLHPSLEEILKDTYGVIVYQEQVMQIAQVLAGYSLGNADLLRRAMGKKEAATMAKEKERFLKGADEQKVDRKVADNIFELVNKFAAYGFNRSHSAAYGLLSYQTAYLKHHYPHEFMAGLMSCDVDNTDNIVKFIAEARAMGLTVERPCVNESAANFTVVPTDKPDVTGGKVIRFGLAAVKGVGMGAVEAILDARNQEGAFRSLFEFANRVDMQKVNRRVIEALIKSGAFDGVGKEGGIHRAQMLGAVDAAIERAAQAQKDRRTGQTSLFGMFESAPEAVAQGESYPDTDEWAPKELLTFEKEALGFYISGHPLDRYRADLTRYADAVTSDFAEGRRAPGEASIGGVVAAYRERPTKKGDGKLAFFQLEDTVGQLEVIVFPKTFEKVRSILVSDEPLLCRGKVVDEGEGEEHAFRMLLEEVTPLADLRRSKTSKVDIVLNADSVTTEQIRELRKILASSPGVCETTLRLRIAMRSEAVIPLGGNYKVAATDDLLLRLERLFGTRVASLG
jgi:DNA polymerase-3 subunit alpha